MTAPLDLPRLFDQAVAHYQAGEPQAAAPILDRLLPHLARNADYLRLCGLVAAALGDNPRAQAAFTAALRLEPASPVHHVNLAAFFRAAGRLDAAADHLRDASALDPANPDLALARAAVLEQAGRREEALAAAERALALDPRGFEAAARRRKLLTELVPPWRFAMTNDAARNAAYARAIARAVRPGLHVLTLGDGSGLLAMMAARAGAAAVTLCEASPTIARAAAEIVRRNGLADRVRVVAKPSAALRVGVDLERPADLLISEIVGSELLSEDVLAAIGHARRELLGPGAPTIPRRVAAIGRLVGGAELAPLLSVGTVEGFDLSPFDRFSPSALVLRLESTRMTTLSGDFELFAFDLAREPPPGEERALAVTATAAGACWGVVQWLRVDLDAETAFENRPADVLAPSGWKHVLFGFGRPVEVAPGQAVRVRARHNNRSLAILPDAGDEAPAAPSDELELRLRRAELLTMAGRRPEARQVLEQAAADAPESARAQLALGQLLSEEAEMARAEELARRAIALDPGRAPARVLLAGILATTGRLPEALDCSRAAVAAEPGNPLSFSDHLFWLNCDPAAHAETVKAAHFAFGERFAPPAAAAPHPNPRDPDRPLRVGYVSPDFGLHAVGIFLNGVMLRHDRARVEPVCFSGRRIEDAQTLRFQQLCEWVPVADLDDESLAAVVRANGIDILVDLSGHTAGNRLLAFARRPAPVQATWLGYPNTTGLRAIDYRLTDAIADPPGAADALHAETLVRLPNGFLCYSPPADSPPVAPVEPGRPVTFGSFCSLMKLNPDTIALWAAVLRAVPDSRLALKGRQLDDPTVKERFRGLFAAHGIGADRLELLDWVPSITENLAQYRRLDIALDPFPYNGTTTTCEALWMGVPVVTLAGDVHRARVGASLLTRIGLAELIAASPQDYLAKAVALAGDRARLARLRGGLRARLTGSALMNGARIARDIEDAYRWMWRRWCAGG